MKKTPGLVVLLLFISAFSAKAQTGKVRDRTATDGPPTDVTDDAQISARFARIEGEWNFLYVYVTSPATSPVPDIYHVTFNHWGSGYAATLTAIKRGVGTSATQSETFATPSTYNLTNVNDAVQGGFPRTQLVFQRAYTDAGGNKVTGSFVIFLVPGTGRIIGTDYADFPTGDTTVVPDFDGFWAGMRGGVPDIDAFEPEALDLYHQVSSKPADQQSAVIAAWAGYGR